MISGGEIVSTFDNPDKVRMGRCDLIEEIIIGEDKLLKFSGMIMIIIIIIITDVKLIYTNLLFKCHT